MKEVLPLAEGWSLSHSGNPLPAQVPGCVHTDLLAADLIPDPFLGVNEPAVAWVGQGLNYAATSGSYRRGGARADRPGLRRTRHRRTITLDGRELGRTRNMHRRYRFDVTGQHGRLEVDFASAYDEAASVRALTGERPNVYPEPFQYIRKMACSFGWMGPTR
ncbi:glycosyl hydrolase 2 galactose-binding domain-containing protein [Streptomyces sp. DHE17-7]|uniref:glycosyl hydrolase 2 galactose-binding domain-containing protein n=1 Tax=Streptomyces sp. DHE17-7 TaxID=2759949 RepID=UPI003FA71BD0